MSDTNRLEEIKKQIKDCVIDAFNEGHKAGLKDGNIDDGTFAAKVREAYNNGLKDAEKAIKRVIDEPSKGGLYANEMQEIFETKGTFAILLSYSMSEIIEKIRKYDERKRQEEPENPFVDEIHIGDEIYCLDKNHKSIVVGFTNKNLSRCLVMSERGFLAMDTDTLHKTGRAYPVKEMFKKLNESEE